MSKVVYRSTSGREVYFEKVDDETILMTNVPRAKTKEPEYCGSLRLQSMVKLSFKGGPHLYQHMKMSFISHEFANMHADIIVSRDKKLGSGWYIHCYKRY
jgi:hypothetical protein